MTAQDGTNATPAPSRGRPSLRPCAHACALALLAAVAPAARAGPTPPVTIAVVVRDTVPLFSDERLAARAGTARLGDGFDVLSQTGAGYAVVLGDTARAWLRASDAGTLRLPLRPATGLVYTRRYHPYVLWYAARHFAAATPADAWPVMKDTTLARVLYARLAREFPADSLAPAPLVVRDVHVRFGATEGGLRLAELDLAQGDTASAATRLRTLLRRRPQLARLHHLDALFGFMIGDLETRARGLGAAGRARGTAALFDVLERHPRDVVQGLVADRVPAREAAAALVDLSRFSSAEVVAHARRIAAMDTSVAVRAVAWVGEGRAALRRRLYAQATSLARRAFTAWPSWSEAAQDQAAPFGSDPRPAASLLFDVWKDGGGDTTRLAPLRTFASDARLSASLRTLARRTIRDALDQGTGTIEQIEALALPDPEGAWQARKESGGVSASISRPAPLLRGVWPGAPSIGALPTGDSVRVLYVDSAWSRAGGRIGHAVKVRTAAGAVGWSHDSAIVRARDKRPRIVAGPPTPGQAASVAVAARDRFPETWIPTAAVDGGPRLLRWSLSGPGGETVDAAPCSGGSAEPSIAREAGAAARVVAEDGLDAVVILARDDLRAVARVPVLRLPGGRGGGSWCVSPGGGLYVFRADSLSRYALSDGSLVWSRAIGFSAGATPVADERYLYATTGAVGGVVRAFDPESGDARWTRGAPDECVRLVAGGGNLLAIAEDEVWAYDAVTGRLSWSQPLFAETETALAGGVAVLATGSELRGLERATGRNAWRVRLSAARVSNICLLDGGDLLAVADATGLLSAIRAADGTFAWRTPLRGWSEEARASRGRTRRAVLWDDAWLSACCGYLAVAADDGIVDVLATSAGTSP